MDHKQYNLQNTRQTPMNSQEQDWVSAPNVTRTDKNLVVKDRFIVNDNETITKIGQTFRRTFFSTLVSGSVYSLTTSEFLLAVTNLSYAPTIGLPRTKLVGEGRNFIIKDEAGGATTTTITIVSAGEETIDGASSVTITSNYGSKDIYTNGANWFTK